MDGAVEEVICGYAYSRTHVLRSEFSRASQLKQFRVKFGAIEAVWSEMSGDSKGDRYQDKAKPGEIRNSNITAAKG